jgi:hypothetical protein
VFLWPETSTEDVAFPKKNNDSLVLRPRHRSRSILLVGEAEKQLEQQRWEISLRVRAIYRDIRTQNSFKDVKTQADAFSEQLAKARYTS